MYQIFCEDMVVGTAEREREGLYYRFFCSCTPPDRNIYRIRINNGVKIYDLGICVPNGDTFSLTTRVPVKNFQGEEMHFTLVSAKQNSMRIPVKTNEPFEQLDKLEAARFLTDNGQPEIVIDPAPDLQDNGQSQEYGHKSP